MKPESKRDILAKLMEKVPLLRQKKIKQGYMMAQINNPIQITPLVGTKQIDVYSEQSQIYQLIPGFKINNQSTYKLHSSQGRRHYYEKNNYQNSSILKTQPSFSINSNISKIYLSPRPIKTVKNFSQAETCSTFRRPIQRKIVMSEKKQIPNRQPSLSSWAIERCDDGLDRQESKSFAE